MIAAACLTLALIHGLVWWCAAKQAAAGAAVPVADARELPFVAEALATIDEGGYPEALARVASLLTRKGEPRLLSLLQHKQALIEKHGDLMPQLPWDAMRRIRGEQDIIVRYEPEKAVATLPKLLADPADRARLAALLQRLAGDERVRSALATPEQEAMAERIGTVLGGAGIAVPRARGARKAARNGAARRKRRRGRAEPWTPNAGTTSTSGCHSGYRLDYRPKTVLRRIESEIRIVGSSGEQSGNNIHRILRIGAAISVLHGKPRIDGKPSTNRKHK